MRKQYTTKQRSELVELVTAGGAAVSEAAARVGVTPSTAYAWVRTATATDPGRQARGKGESEERRPSAPRFVRVVPSREAGAAIAVRVGAAEIQVWRDFDADLLRAVVTALGGGAA
jgi:transposase-like protein